MNIDILNPVQGFGTGSRKIRFGIEWTSLIGRSIRGVCFSYLQFISPHSWERYLTDNERNQANRGISTGQLHALPRFHIQPINVVVYNGSQGKSGFEGGFPLRCFQRLSCPNVATRQCHWRDNRNTRGSSTPVLSY